MTYKTGPGAVGFGPSTAICSITSSEKFQVWRHIMAATHSATKKKPVAKTIVFGAVTAALYAAAFWNSDYILQLFTKGGYYAALPIATVFIVSFAHGTFASNLWSMLGIEAITKQPAKRPEVRPVPRPAQRPRPRVRLNV
jgi:hypothetical protein